ncbi:NifB/NifX family molybdenum-iron cluster-binding protein [Candidatus Omnitrophota bacterium]
MRIAFPLWHDSVSPVLDTAEKLVVVDIDSRTVVSRHEIIMSDEPQKKAELIAQQADMLVCGAISRVMSSYLVNRGIRVYPWLMGNVDSLIKIFSDGNTPGQEFNMPGCGRNREGRGGCGGRFRRGEQSGCSNKKQNFHQ